MGCESLPKLWDKPEPGTPQPVVLAPAPQTRPPVTADQITPENARDMANALSQEIDHDDHE
jgi:hypothetical protein